uniref:Uncharacterized protein n=1 Tax=Octopus bimaculoides TaxID=37653 RepID=A0A0L8GVF3_OCTBM
MIIWLVAVGLMISNLGTDLHTFRGEYRQFILTVIIIDYFPTKDQKQDNTKEKGTTLRVYIRTCKAK